MIKFELNRNCFLARICVLTLFAVCQISCQCAIAQEAESKPAQKGYWSKRPMKTKPGSTKQETAKDAAKEKESKDQKVAAKEKQKSEGPTYVDPEKRIWEFGLKITAGNSCKGLTATFPIPMDWPEQAIVKMTEIKTDNVTRMTEKKIGPTARQLVMRINKLGPGEVAEAVVRVELDKSWMESPADPSKLSFANKLPAKLRSYTRPSPYIESSNKRIKQLAAEIEQPEGQGDWEHVESIYKWVRARVEYKFDKQIHTCLHALDAGHGDCQELTSIFIAICRAKGIPARAVWVPNHEYPEFYMEDSEGNGHWIPAQLAGTYQFGAMSEWKPILQKGDSFRMPGSSKPTRYVAPVLVDQSQAGGQQIEHILREIKPMGSKSASDEGTSIENQSSDSDR